MSESLRFILADITALAVDAVVNAANMTLESSGGGVSGAIHRAAGPHLMAECRRIGGCPIGEARVTKGYNLPVKHIIHTVGPVWHGGKQGEPEKLASCYRESLRLAAELGCQTVAFPSISTGVYGYPVHRASRIALREIVDFLKEHPEMEIVIACYDEETLKAYEFNWNMWYQGEHPTDDHHHHHENDD